MANTCAGHSLCEIEPLLFKEVEQELDYEFDAMMAYLLTKGNMINVKLQESQQKVAELEVRLQKLKSMSTELLTELQK